MCLNIVCFFIYTRYWFERWLQINHCHRWSLPIDAANHTGSRYSGVSHVMGASTSKCQFWEHHQHQNQSFRWQHHIRSWCTICWPQVWITISKYLNHNPQIFGNVQTTKITEDSDPQILHDDIDDRTAAGVPTLNPRKSAHGGASGGEIGDSHTKPVWFSGWKQDKGDTIEARKMYQWINVFSF